MFSRSTVVVLSLATVLAAAAPPPSAAAAVDSNTFGGLLARPIGPAVMSGRIAAIDAVPGPPLTIWVGAASGGVWKSTDAGVTWGPVFDDHPQSIGAVRVDPTRPDVVWVGTGESWVRNSVSVGTGLYKTTDGGDSWKLVGLEDSERIARIAVDPSAPDTVYVCATGHLWGANEERGLYKTTDGGESWQRVLWVDADTGCADVALDPQTPSVVYAAMWQFRRRPDFFSSGGPGSGLYRSTDGGATWSELAGGLPAGEKGRIAVAVAPSRPSRVYAVVESGDTALYRSDDLGATWTRLNNSFNVTARPFYFAHLVVDPVDFDRVYKPGFSLSVSRDGGRSFTSMFTSGFGGNVHPDHHALWIDPANPHHLVLGTDGGVYVSYDRGTSFRFVAALPVSQFYEVGYDLEWPYNVYGGLQDNGSWMGPSRGAGGGVFNSDWKLLGFGDGFHSYRDPHQPDVVFVEFQGGKLLRHHLPTGEIKWISPLEGEGEERYRFNWNTPLLLSPSTPGTLYYGAQYLFRSPDRGESWERISPDLTTDDPGRQRQLESGGLTIDNSTAENNTTIFTISESPLEPDLIWVGTDDGLVQVTRDGGATWNEVSGRMPGLPAGLWVSHVEAGPHQAGTAHVSVDGHRSGDMGVYLYRTTDYGESWTSIAGEGLEGFVHVVAQDPVNPALLYAGTEFGLYLSLDGGGHWARFAGDLPRVPVHDLDVHPREHDLIVGTHGRGIYILDDLTPLRALTAETLESELELLPSRDAVMELAGGLSWFNGDDEFVGRNPPQAASIAFYQKKRHIFGDLKIEIYDAEGELVSTVPAPKLKGLNRAEWPMRLPPPKMPAATSLVPIGAAFLGPRVPEGTYTFKLIKGSEVREGSVTLVPDPRSPHSAEDRQLQQETAMRLYRLLERLTYLVDAAVDLKEQAAARAGVLGGRDRLARRLDELATRLEALRAGLVSTSEAGMIGGDEKLRELLALLFGAVAGYDGRPSPSQLDRAAVLAGELEAAEGRLEALGGEAALADLNAQLERRGQEPLVRLDRDLWRQRQEQGGGSGPYLGRRALTRLLAQLPLLPMGV